MKVALVTGASKGMGLAIAKAFKEKGFGVVGTYNKTEPCADIDFMKCDLKDNEQVKALVQKVYEKYGKIDLLVNNAGISHTGIISDVTDESFEEMTAVNFRAVFNLCKYVSEIMVKQKSGCIINISSVWGNEGASCEVLYSALKGGVNTLTKALAKELAPSGIRVNAVAPGVIKTDMLSCYSEEDLRALSEETPLGRLGKPEDVAKAVLFLEDADFVTGQIITVDGGFAL